MLTRENELRLSEAVQLRFKAAEASVDSEWMCVAQEIQEQVINEFSKASHSSLDVMRHMDVALFELRAAANRHPGTDTVVVIYNNNNKIYCWLNFPYDTYDRSSMALSNLSKPNCCIVLNVYPGTVPGYRFMCPR